MQGKLEKLIRDSASESFSRSGGPGGQNVNKVNTQVTLHVLLDGLQLTDEERSRLEQRLGNRINAEGELVVQCSETRSQAKNREIAIERTISLIASALRKEKKRRPTRPSRAARERRLRQKRERAERKQSRKRPDA